MRLQRLAAAAACALALSGCAYHLEQVKEPGRAAAFTTGGPWSSMVYAARTDSGVVLVDLGYVRSAAALRGQLRRLGAVPADVTDVLLTHSHRDHVRAWKAVRGARFHLWAPEQPLFEGTSRHVDLPSRTARATFGHAGPAPGEVDVRAFRADTTWMIGRDTVRAYTVPGHTAGSAAYLFRGVLFVGDAVARKPLRGFRGADPFFSADTRLNRQSLVALFARVPADGVRWVCNAHAKCARFDERFVARVTR